MCTRSFRGGETGARPRFPGLARLNHAQQLQRSPASSQLSKISREDPPPLRDGTQAPTDMSAVSWNHLDYRVVKICCLFFCFFCESLHACRDHACNVHTHRPSEHVWVCFMKNKCQLLSKSCLAAIKSSDPDTQR